MKASRLLVALCVVPLLAASPAFAANHVGNGAVAEMGLACTFHWTATCDAAYGVTAKRAPLKPNGEGLPLPWPFPWKLMPHPATA